MRSDFLHTRLNFASDFEVAVEAITLATGMKAHFKATESTLSQAGEALGVAMPRLTPFRQREFLTSEDGLSAVCMRVIQGNLFDTTGDLEIVILSGTEEDLLQTI